MIQVLSSRRPAAVLPMLALAFAFLWTPAARAQDTPPPPTCDATTLTGKYLMKVNGSYYDSQFYVYLLALTGFYTFDANGGLSGGDTISNDGTIGRRTVTGTYTVNADCTGSIVITGSDKLVLHADIVIDNAKGISLVGTDNLTVISGTGAKQ